MLQREEATGSTFYHVNARRLDYPDSTIPRFPVLEEKVPWEVDFILYNPPVLNGDSQDQTDGNPGGRTGMKGRGALTCLGPNLILDPVLTRYEAPQIDNSLSCIPNGTLFPKCAGILVIAEVSCCTCVLQVHEGYVDDVRNTDDAWVETTVLNIHLDRRSLLMSGLWCCSSGLELVVWAVWCWSSGLELVVWAVVLVQWFRVSSLGCGAVPVI
uniref:Uncharacterized protein n=1 Tax=Oncorhynchus mykiss TaxID=8022 RepID=A0A8L0DUT5_ONCMY